MTSEYADVLDMFRELRKLPADSAQFVRRRDLIVERCLPLADHIARRFEGRAAFGGFVEAAAGALPVRFEEGPQRRDPFAVRKG